jgi:hypothetical protein
MFVAALMRCQSSNLRAIVLSLGRVAGGRIERLEVGSFNAKKRLGVEDPLMMRAGQKVRKLAWGRLLEARLIGPGLKVGAIM